jgi:hypothetical protein
VGKHAFVPLGGSRYRNCWQLLKGVLGFFFSYEKKEWYYFFYKTLYPNLLKSIWGCLLTCIHLIYSKECLEKLTHHFFVVVFCIYFIYYIQKTGKLTLKKICVNFSRDLFWKNNCIHIDKHFHVWLERSWYGFLIKRKKLYWKSYFVYKKRGK